MDSIQRKDIQIISQHTPLTEDEIARVLQEKVYPGKAGWHTFLRYLLLAMGIGFSVAGIVFFFAYNWAGLHKFARLGLTEGLLIACTSLALLPKMSNLTRNIVLTGAAILVGVLFAVFGQVYQTGANAYDFFLAWTVFVSLWVFVSGFAPLWLFYLVLINTTFLLYAEQVAGDWSGVTICSILFLMNTAVLMGCFFLGRQTKPASIPKWFRNLVALASVTYATIGLVMGIFEKFTSSFLLLLLATILVFTLGILQGLKEKISFYLAIIPLSLVVIVSALLIEISKGAGTFLMVSFFIMASVTVLVLKLLELQKKWIHEN